MGGTAVTPDANPFDKPFQSDVQAAQQAKAATPPARFWLTNPFDAPFASDIAEKNAKERSNKQSWETPSDISSGPDNLCILIIELITKAVAFDEMHGTTYDVLIVNGTDGGRPLSLITILSIP